VSLPLVSCLVTAYNYERFLERAVESALAQDYPALEVVVVDDGSTDGTGAVADALAARDPRVRVVHQENQGWTAAFNRAISEARGELYAILDADDTWLPGKLRTQVELLLARPEVGLVYSDLAVTDEHDGVVKPSFWADRGVRPFSGRCAAGLVTVGNTATTSSIVVRASLRDAFFPIPDDVPYGDWWLAFRTACVAEIDYVDRPLTGYRFHGSNLTLDAGGEALVRELRKEHAFRRAALARLEPGVLTVRESADAFQAIERSAGVVLTAARSALTPLPAGRPDEARVEVDAADAAPPLTALRLLLRAVALDPFDSSIRARFVEALGALADDPDAREETVEPSFLALGFLDELVEGDMLPAYARAFAGRDDALLVVLAPGADEAALGSTLEPLAQALGLDRDGSAEVVVVTDPAAEAQLAPRAAAVYTRVHRNGSLRDLPQLGDAQALVRVADGGEPAETAVCTVVAFVDELLAKPELLRGFDETFAGEAVRLVVYAPGADAATVAARLEEHAACEADLVLLAPAAADDADVAARADLLLTDAPCPRAFDALPRVVSIDGIRRFADLTASPSVL
jgi:hypothetical protein